MLVIVKKLKMKKYLRSTLKLNIYHQKNKPKQIFEEITHAKNKFYSP